ncbi:RNA polymerase sigma factor [Flexithrix dorotheae]|uniref:RNA polymerase sigma factor n=1 Tax=Flexithrix dorotheae TaxID=70993 RepID=UPI00039E0121|nr:sigma-70 family RNA polymerase sigma factor [Flexithrix dorotheae]
MEKLRKNPLTDAKNLHPYPEKESNPRAYFSQKSELQIWKEFKNGSEVALINIYKFYYKTLYNYASQFTFDKNLIHDVIQDLFIELIKKRQKLSDTTSIKFYLFRSVKTRLIGKLRKNKKIDYKENILDCYDFAISFSTESILINQQIKEEQKKRLNAALQKLTSKQREIIYYYYFENLNLAEISVLMNFSNPKSAQNLLYKSIHHLKGIVLISYIIILTYLFRFL